MTGGESLGYGGKECLEWEILLEQKGVRQEPGRHREFLERNIFSQMNCITDDELKKYSHTSVIAVK